MTSRIIKDHYVFMIRRETDAVGTWHPMVITIGHEYLEWDATRGGGFELFAGHVMIWL